ncbi:hypothetical protein GGG16DRAFT_102680 [Schizophyllum commune]
MPPTDAAMAIESKLQTTIEKTPMGETEAPRRAAKECDGTAWPSTSNEFSDDVPANSPSSDAAEETTPSSPPGDAMAGRPQSVRHQCLVCHNIFQRYRIFCPPVLLVNPFRPSALKTHMNIHSNQRPFACGYPGCASRFNARSNAIRHQHMHGTDFVRSLEAEKRAAEERAAREALEDGSRFAETIVAFDAAPPSAAKGRARYSNVRWMPTNQPTRYYAPYTSSLRQPRRVGRMRKGDASQPKRAEFCFEDAPS